jgi:hypothetical protein
VIGAAVIFAWDVQGKLIWEVFEIKALGRKHGFEQSRIFLRYTVVVQEKQNFLIECLLQKMKIKEDPKQ